MKKYIMPTIKVKQIETEAILAASDPASNKLYDDDADEIKSADDIEAKQYHDTSLWDED